MAADPQPLEAQSNDLFGRWLAHHEQQAAEQGETTESAQGSSDPEPAPRTPRRLPAAAVASSAVQRDPMIGSRISAPSNFGTRRPAANAPQRPGQVNELDREPPTGWEPILVRSIRKKAEVAEAKQAPKPADRRGRLARLKARLVDPPEPEAEPELPKVPLIPPATRTTGLPVSTPAPAPVPAPAPAPTPAAPPAAALSAPARSAPAPQAPAAPAERSLEETIRAAVGPVERMVARHIERQAEEAREPVVARDLEPEEVAPPTPVRAFIEAAPLITAQPEPEAYVAPEPEPVVAAPEPEPYVAAPEPEAYVAVEPEPDVAPEPRHLAPRHLAVEPEPEPEPEPFVPESFVPEPTFVEPVAAEPAVPEAVAAEPVIAEPVVVEEFVEEEFAEEEFAEEPVTTVVAESVVAQAEPDPVRMIEPAALSRPAPAIEPEPVVETAEEPEQAEPPAARRSFLTLPKRQPRTPTRSAPNRTGDAARDLVADKAKARAKTAAPPLAPPAPPAAVEVDVDIEAAPEPAPPAAHASKHDEVAVDMPRIYKFPPKRTARRVLTLWMLLGLAATAYFSRLAVSHKDTASIGLAAIVTLATAMVWAIRAGASVTKLEVHQGQLEVMQQGGRYVFDLASQYINIEVHGQPGKRGWKVLFPRRDMPPFTVDASMVDPDDFMRVLRFFRPNLVHH